ncbi:MAG: quinolinate synthase NadA [Deltaproteobacteria bacterium]|nr:quinolinate synthase NadA [Deltaproteobacteria bacterium]MCL5277138.1 quinolinate synthase NadA [Deltaproteobacteria bacterium]
MEIKELQDRIRRLLKEKNAIMLAHNYQRAEIQEIADLTGDSYELSVRASKTDADVIVFCGVRFMAESAKILSPGKTVLLPNADAGCPMADMIDAGELERLKSLHPGACVVSYVNTNADVKALSDVCCTSSNAVDIVRAVPADRVIFVPDKNLGSYVRQFVDKEMIVWDGYCPTHHHVYPEEITLLKQKYPGAPFLCHPECRPEVVGLADRVTSTSGIIRFAREDPHTEFIIGTEEGILYQLRRNSPEKRFILASHGFVCPNMKRTRLEDVAAALEEGRYEIKLSPTTIEKARVPLERMIDMGIAAGQK